MFQRSPPEVLCTHVPEKFLRQGGGPELERMHALCYADGTYWALGKPLEPLYYTRPKHD